VVGVKEDFLTPAGLRARAFASTAHGVASGARVRRAARLAAAAWLSLNACAAQATPAVQGHPDPAWLRAQAAGVPAAAWQQALLLAREAAAAQAPAGARLVVQAGLLDARLRLAPCDAVQAQPAHGAPAQGRTRVALRCTQPAAGQRAWVIHLPVTVQVWAPAWVTQQALPHGQALRPEHLALAETDWTATATPPLPPTALPWDRSLLRTLPAGSALRATDLQQRRWFSGGQTVRVLLQGRGFDIVAQGLALGDGIEGRPARVRLDSGRVLTGQPVGEQVLRVTL
jgi:flagella basal body P-ring formation protein FlgA